MRINKRILSFVLLLAAVICMTVACKDDGGSDVPDKLLGEYYAMSGTTENVLKIEKDNRFTFIYDGQTMSGDVTFKDDTLTFTADGESIATGAPEGDTISLQYGSISLKLLKKIDLTLTFDTKGGSNVAAQTVLNGKAPAMPTAPTREGHKFVGWYADEDFTTAFDFSEPMASSKTAYALWSKMEYETEFNVSLDLNYDGAPAPRSVQTVGNRLFETEVPKRNGYIFKGWYISQYYSADKLSYLFVEGKTVVDEDTTLYAFWQAEDARVQAPVITVNGSNVSWGRVEGAGVTYKVTIKAPNGDYIKNEESTSNPLVTGVITLGGDYEITVTAVRGDSSASATIYYRIAPLDSVGGFTLDGNILRFNSVPGADKYLISVICADPDHHTDTVETADTHYDFTACAMGGSGIRISVTAVADGHASSIASEKVVKSGELGLTTYPVTLYKGEHGELTKMAENVTQGFRFVLPVPEVDPNSEYQFVAWYADAAFTTPLTDISGKSLNAWSGNGNVQAYAYFVNDIFSYNLITVGGVPAYEISAGKNFGRFTSVTVPSVYNGKPVARIQANAFANKTAVTRINIPDTVLEIGDGAFKGCTALTDLRVYDAGNSADAYTDIDGVIFAIDKYTGKLSLFKMPEGRDGKYTVPDNVVAVLDRAFESSDITDVTISSDVTAIGVEAFINSELKSIHFAPGNDSLTIADRAFMNSRLEEIHLPARLTSIALKRLEICEVTSGWSTVTEPVTDISKATDAFYGCTALTLITVENGNRAYKAVGNVLFSADAKTLIYAPYTLSGEYSVPINTQAIASGAFYGTAITDITIANTVTDIGEGAFFAHQSLTTVRFSDDASVGAITIGRYAFGSTSTIRNALTSFIVNDNTKIQTICDYAFYYSQKLEEIHISQFTTAIGKEAFAFCRGATSIDFSVGNEIAESALEIGVNAFKNVPVVTITLGSSFKEFPLSAFSEADKLAEICVAEDHKTLVSHDGVLYTKENGKAHTLILFPAGKGGSFVIPDGVVAIDDNALSNKKLLMRVTIPASVTRIGNEAFLQGWETSLSEIIFTGTPAEGAELTIGTKAFYNAGLISAITLPSHTKSIGENAFYQLGSRSGTTPTIILNDGLEHIGAYAFATTNISYIAIPSTVRSIGNNAFADLTTLTSVVFGTDSKLLEIGEKAFFGCPIEDLKIPASVEVIKPFAFASGITFADDESGGISINYGGAGGVRSVTFESGSKLKTISAFAFAGSSIESIVIPKTVTFIGAYAFAGTAGSLRSVTFEDGGTEELKLGTESTVTVPVGTGIWAASTSCSFSGYVFDGASLTAFELPTSRDSDVDENALKNCGSIG